MTAKVSAPVTAKTVAAMMTAAVPDVSPEAVTDMMAVAEAAEPERSE